MIELEINGNAYDLADSWEEITFAQYIDIINLNKDKGLNEMSKAVKIVAAISNNPTNLEPDLLKMAQEDFENLAKEFEWTTKSIDEVKNEKDIIEIDGKSYKIKKNYNKLTIGEIVSTETLIGQNKNLDPLEIAFGILLREIDADGKEKDFNEDDFLHIISELKTKVLLLDVYNCISFFLSGDKTSSETSKGYSIKKKQKTIPVE